MKTYIRFARNGQTVRRPLFCTTIVVERDNNGKKKMVHVSRIRHGKTEKDHRSGAHNNRFRHRRERDSWRAETREKTYLDPQAMPAFPQA